MPNRKAISLMLLCIACFLALAGVSTAKTDHKEFKNSKLDDCKDCHNGAAIVGNHGGNREHRLLAQRAGSNCADCHLQSFCQDCHNGGNVDVRLQKSLSRTGETMPRTHRSDFVSLHPLKAKDDPQSCYRCHESRFCSDCHAKLPNRGTIRIKGHTPVGNTQRYFLTRSPAPSPSDVAAHAAEARRNLQSCEGCHPDAVVCSQCHNLSAKGKVFKR